MNFRQFLSEMVFKGPHGRIVYGPASQDDIDYVNEGLPQKLPEPITYIEDMFISPEYRGSVAAIKMFQDFLSQHGGQTLICQAYPYEEGPGFGSRQKQLIRFHERFGFVHVGQGWMYRLGHAYHAMQ